MKNLLSSYPTIVYLRINIKDHVFALSSQNLYSSWKGGKYLDDDD